jgi:hypothetical protein
VTSLEIVDLQIDSRSVSAKRRRCQRVGDSLPLGTASRAEKTLRERNFNRHFTKLTGISPKKDRDLPFGNTS